MRITLMTPMEEEKKKILNSLAKFPSLKHTYEVVGCGVGRENMAKGMMDKPKSDLTVLVGFAAIVGVESTMPDELKKGGVVEVGAASLFGYTGERFENGGLKLNTPKTKLPCLTSLTSDKFVRTTNISIGTLVNMEDYTFMCLKDDQDFIIRIISDFLPHQGEIDFYKAIADIEFDKVVETLEQL